MTKKIIILVSISVVSLIIGFFIGRNFTLKRCKDSEIKLEKDLNKVTSEMTDIEKRNNDLLELNDIQQKINDELKIENNAMKEDLGNIKSTAKSTKEKLNELEQSVNETTSTIQKLRNNNSILREYFQSTCEIIGE